MISLAFVVVTLHLMLHASVWLRADESVQGVLVVASSVTSIALALAVIV